jgi:hypothetical protein
MKQIPLTKGQFALVDDEDYEHLNKFKWQAYFAKNINNFYAVSGKWNGKNMTNFRMHRIIMNVKNSKIFVDHKDHNTLNNQRSNLRLATPLQNQANQKSHRDSVSKYVGVRPKRNKWEANIRNTYLGTFIDEVSAAKAYDNAAKKLYGEFANLNFPT